MTQITGFELLLRRWVRNSSADLEANPTTQSQGTVGIDAHRRASHIELSLFIKVRKILYCIQAIFDKSYKQIVSDILFSKDKLGILLRLQSQITQFIEHPNKILYLLPKQFLTLKAFYF